MANEKESLQALIQTHQFQQYYLRCGCSCGWGTTLGGSYGDWAEHFAALLAAPGPRAAFELTSKDFDAVMARTHVMVPKDMKCHKCGAEEPWKDPRRGAVAAALAEQERLNDPKTWEGIGSERAAAPAEADWREMECPKHPGQRPADCPCAAEAEKRRAEPLRKHIDEKLEYLRDLKSRNDATEYALIQLEVYERIAELAAEPLASQGVSASLEFKLAQAKDLLEMFGGDETLITVAPYEGKLVAYASEYPDEGSIVLGESQQGRRVGHE